MAEFPALPLWTDAYLADTRELTAAQHGAYFLLLITAWRTKENGLPDDDDKLARWAAMDRRSWIKNKHIIMSFWFKKDGYWHQKRLDDERKHAEHVRDSQVRAGLASALKRKETQSRHVATELPTALQPPSPSPSPLPKEEVKKDTPLPPKGCEEALLLYNETAERIGIPKVQKLTSARQRSLSSRLKDCGGIDGWKAALEKLEAIPAMRGDNKNGWKADFDFLIRESSFTKLMEGKYDGWQQAKSGSELTKQRLQEWVDGR